MGILTIQCQLQTLMRLRNRPIERMRPDIAFLMSAALESTKEMQA